MLIEQPEIGELVDERFKLGLRLVGAKFVKQAREIRHVPATPFELRKGRIQFRGKSDLPRGRLVMKKRILILAEQMPDDHLPADLVHLRDCGAAAFGKDFFSEQFK